MRETELIVYCDLLSENIFPEFCIFVYSEIRNIGRGLIIRADHI